MTQPSTQGRAKTVNWWENDPLAPEQPSDNTSASGNWWESDPLASDTQEDAPRATQPRRQRTAGDVAADLAKGFGGAAVSAVGAVPTAVGRAIQEGSELAFGLTMEEARALAEAEGTPEKALEWYERANRLNPISAAGRAIESGGRWMSQQGDKLREGRSDEAKELARQSTPDGDITKPSTWTLGENPTVEGVAQVAADVVGSMAPPVATAIATRGRSATTQMRAGGATVAGQIAGSAMDEAGTYLGQFSDEQLRQVSPVFRQLESKGYSAADARTILERDAENRAAAYAAPVGYAGGQATAAILGKPGEKLAGQFAGMLPKAIVLGTLGATEEALQEMAEGVSTRAGINDAAGTERSLTEGTFGEAVLGAKGGGVTGAGRGVGLGIRDRFTTPSQPIDSLESEQPSAAPVTRAPEQATAQRTSNEAQPSSASRESRPEVRLAELDLLSQTRPLTAQEVNEAETLLARLDAGDVTDTQLPDLESLEAEPVAQPTEPVAPMDEQAPQSAIPAPAPIAVSEKALTNFWTYAKERGYTPGQVKKGSELWTILKADFDQAKANAKRANNPASILPTTTAQPSGQASAQALDQVPPTPIAPAPGVDPALQNRDRSRAASVAQMADIARNPDYMRLATSRTPDAGAPMVFIVGDDIDQIPEGNEGRADVAVMADGQRVPFRYAVVDARTVQPSNFADGRVNDVFTVDMPGTIKALNNGRTAGLRAAYEQGTAGNYQAELIADAEAHGVPVEAIQRTPNPILVRVYSERSNTPDMAAKSQGQGLGMSPTELARQDAPLIDANVLAAYQPGDVTSAANRDFVRAFVGKINQAGQDVAGMMTAEGSLSPAGRQRIQAALMQAAYGDADLVAELFDSLDTDIKAIGEALKAVAGEWANMRDSARQGLINPDADITDNLVQAVNLVRKARRDNASLYDLVNQTDLMTGEVPDPLTVGALRFFYPSQYMTRAAGREAIVSALRDYTTTAMGTAAGADLFGQVVTPSDILNGITEQGATNAQDSTQESSRGTDASGTDGRRADAAGQGTEPVRNDRAGQEAGSDRRGERERQQAQREAEPGNESGSEGTASATADALPGQRSATQGEARGVANRQAKAEDERIEDVGEQLYANRRNFTGRGLKWEDVEGLNDTLKVKEVTKAKVWPRPNYEQLVADGMPPVMARMVKNVYDGLSAGPTIPGGTPPTDADLKRYIDTLAKVREGLFGFVNDRQQVADFAKGVLTMVRGDATALGSVSILDMAKQTMDAREISTVLVRRVWPEQFAANVPTMGRFIRGTEAQKQASIIGGNKALGAMQFDRNDISKWVSDLGKGRPSKREAWQVQGYRVLAPGEYTAAGQEQSDGTTRMSIRPKEGRGTWRTVFTDEQMTNPPFVLVQDGGFSGQPFPTREAAIEAAREKVKRSAGAGQDIRGTNIEDAERTGPARRQDGEDITPQRLMEAFGFRGVNFGREGWINQAERQEYLNQAYDGLMDLADILGVPAKAMSLDGKLGIAFGAQGKGGANAAHFVPGYNEINLTKTKGAGTLAHEWGHALDHHFATLAALEKDKEPFLSEHASKPDTLSRVVFEGGKYVNKKDIPTFGEGIRPEIVQAFRSIYQAMEKRNESPGEMATRREFAKAAAVKRLDSWLKAARRQIEESAADNKADLLAEFDQHAEKFREGDTGDGYEKAGKQVFGARVAAVRNLIKDATGRLWSADETKGLDQNASYVKSLLGKKDADTTHEPQKVATQYKADSAAMDREKGGKAYWSTPTEMFARAFELYVHDKLSQRDQRNTFLTDAEQRASKPVQIADESSAVARASGATRDLYLYPVGKERETLRDAFDNLVGQLKTRDTERGVLLFDIPRLSDNPLTRLPDPARANVLANLRALEKRLEGGKITAEQYRAGVQDLIERIEQRNETKLERSIVKGRERGPDWIVERLIRAKRKGELDAETVDFTLWLLDKNPALAEDLGIGLPEGKGSGAAGDYNPATRVIRLFKSSANTTTGVHEILHHTERMMPVAVQNGILKEYRKAWSAAYEKADEATKSLLSDMLAASAGDPQARRNVMAAFKDGRLNYDAHYPLYNASEFWAVNATDILSKRYGAQGSWIAQAKRWLSEMLEYIKGALGLRSDAPLLRGLRAVINGDGQRITRRMLNNSDDVLNDIAARGATIYSTSGRSVPLATGQRVIESAVAEEIEQRIGQFAHQPTIVIRDTAEGVLPGATKADGVAGAVHEGRIFLFLDQMATRGDVQETLFHELFHYGVRRIFTREQFIREMGSLYERDAWVKARADAWVKTSEGKAAAQYGGDEYALARGVDETLARLAEPNAGTYTRTDAFSRAIVNITGWLADLAQRLGFTQYAAKLRGIKNQEARELVQRVFRTLETQANPEHSGWMDDAEPAFSRNSIGGNEPPQIQPEQQNAWTRAKAKAMELTSPQSIDKLIYEFQDKYIDLKRLREHIKAIGGTITDLNDAYLGEELYHKRLAKRTEDFLDKELKPLLADMRSRSVSLPELERFLHARHAPEANKTLAERNPNRAMIEDGKAEANSVVRDLELQLQRARANRSATKAILEALAEARAEAATWNGAQAFRGTEDERLSLSGMSDADAKAYMDSLTPRQRQDFKELAERVDAIQAKTLDALEGYGLMDKATLNAWRSAYKFYVPLHRDEARPESDRHPIGQGFSVKGTGMKSRVGSNEKVTNILAHIAMQRETALTRGEKNNVVKRLYLMAAQNPDEGFWEIDKPPQVKTIDPRTGFVRSGIDPTYKHRPNVVMVRIAGRDQAIVFNEQNPQAVRLAEAMKNLDVGDLHVVLGLAAKGTRWFASVNTQYNPIFGLINFARDVQAGLLNLSTTELADKQKEVASHVFTAMRAIYRERRGKSPKSQQWTRLWDEFQDVGGTTGYRDLFTDAQDRANSLVKELNALDRGQASKAAHAVVDWLSDYNETMENAVRLAAYKVAIDQGMTKERAASLAKNITVNFNRKGRQTREIGALYAFFNAALQGTARMVETLRGPIGKRIMYGGVLLGAVNTLIGMAMMGGDDDEADNWDQIPEFIKERSIIIPLGREDYITIPMPLGFHLFPNIGRIAVEFALGDSEKSLGSQTGKLLLAITDAFNPLGGAQNLGQLVAPTVIDPVVALMQNKDWTGKPIYRENANGLDPQPGHRMVNDSASTPSRAVAEAINKITGGTDYRPGAWSPTPDQLDYVIGQLTGGLGREMLKVNQTLSSTVTGDELPPYKIPLVGRLYGNTRGAAGQSGRYYENVKLLNELENEYKGRLRNREDVNELRENEPLLRLIGLGNGTENQVRNLREMRRQAVERKEPGYQERVKQIDERIGENMARLNTEVAKARREAAR